MPVCCRRGGAAVKVSLRDTPGSGCYECGALRGRGCCEEVAVLTMGCCKEECVAGKIEEAGGRGKVDKQRRRELRRRQEKGGEGEKEGDKKGLSKNSARSREAGMDANQLSHSMIRSPAQRMTEQVLSTLRCTQVKSYLLNNVDAVGALSGLCLTGVSVAGRPGVNAAGFVHTGVSVAGRPGVNAAGFVLTGYPAVCIDRLATRFG
eukprot:350056-Chlamydomonas_euryale.AAC.4